jgi:hypothetical protein
MDRYEDLAQTAKPREGRDRGYSKSRSIRTGRGIVPEIPKTLPPTLLGPAVVGSVIART